MFLSPDILSSPLVVNAPPTLQVEVVLEQGSAAINEDVLLQDDHLYGVFDGATSLHKETYANGRTGGLLAAEAAALAFRSNGASLLDLAERANSLIKQAMIKRGIDLDRKENLWSTSAAVVRIQDDHLEWCQIGDCLILLLYDDGSYRLLADPPNHDMETLSLWKQHNPKPGECIGELLAEQIRKVRQGMNVNYGVFNGEQEALRFLNSGTESLANVSDILLFTDGLSLPCANPEAGSDLSTLTSLYRQGGLIAIRDRIRELQLQDPTCHTYPRFKIHDDIGAIAIPFLPPVPFS